MDAEAAAYRSIFFRLLAFLKPYRTGLAIRQLLGATSLDDCIGRTFDRDGAIVIPLPHPSGVSRWTNAPENRSRLELALALIRAQLQPPAQM